MANSAYPSSSKNWGMAQSQVRILLVFLVFLFILFSYWAGLFERLELVSLDYRFRLRADKQVRSDIVVIEISDDSVNKIGRWPWDRDWHATLIKILNEAGAKAIAFDILFSEKSDPEKDKILSVAIREAGNVYLPVVIKPETSQQTDPAKTGGLFTSLPEFIEYAKGMGHINLEPDLDGVMRRIPLILETGHKKIPQLGFQMALDQMGISAEQLKVPLDEKGNLIIDWKGKWTQTFEHVSYFDVISSYAAAQKGEKPSIPPDFFKNKICFVGGTATALFDIQPTPLEPAYPGVGVNLHVLNNILERKFIVPAGQAGNILVMFFTGLLLAFIVRIESYFKSALFCAGIAVCYTLAAVGLFVYAGIWINMAYALILILMIYVAVTLYNQLSITFERSKLFQMATQDPLTGLYNIGHFKLLFKAELAALAAGRIDKLSVVMGDVDLFKKVNDTYGHVTGDQVLREVAQIIKNNSRALDITGRYGGEEFILILPGASVQEAYRVAEKIRKAVMEKTFSHEKGDFQATISLGVTEVPHGEDDIEKTVQKADTALYLAKHRGRNRTIISGDTPGYFPHPIEP